MRSIEVFGRPTEELVAQLQAKARLLGDAVVIVRDLDAGFDRLPRD